MPQISPMSWLFFLLLFLSGLMIIMLMFYWLPQLKFPNFWKINLLKKKY